MSGVLAMRRIVLSRPRFLSSRTDALRRVSSQDTATPADRGGVSLYDSLSERVLPLVRNDTDDPRALAWYTCGPTTYAPAHMGHARTYVCLDVVRRVIERERSSALFVMNVTDVDDKILAAAAADDDPLALARRYEAEFWSDLDRLGCLRPHVVTRVTECVEPIIVPYVEALVRKGLAYLSDDGVYFHTRAFQETLGHITKYGKLAPAGVSEDFYDSNWGEGGSKKKDPRDFVLWKLKKPGEKLSWPSPWGEGRPGWHIECSAMIEAVQEQFKSTHKFLVHAGGVDLKFPHHTNEIAQAEAYREEEWIPHWVHTGHLHIDGQKMSKSLKNFVSIQQFFEKNESDDAPEQGHVASPSDDFRLWCLCLSGSYRSPATFSESRIVEARNIRLKIVQFLMDVESVIEGSNGRSKTWRSEDVELFTVANSSQAKALEALAEDLNGSLFLDCIMEIVDKGSAAARNPQASADALRITSRIIRDLLGLVGFSNTTCQAGLVAADGGQNAQQAVGGEKALMDEFVSFRSTVREAALDCVREGADSLNVMKGILKECDRVRDTSMPRIGVQIVDSKVDSELSEWKFCVPRSEHQTEKQISTEPTADILSVPLEQFFRVGRYEAMFSEYNEEGFPTKNADGSDISKRMQKKLQKKQKEHIQRLEKAHSSSGE